jgi:hypothetical protein
MLTGHIAVEGSDGGGRSDSGDGRRKVNGELPVPVDEALGDERQRAILALLEKRTPREAVRYRQGPGGQKLAYVEGAYVIRQLNLLFPGAWSFEILETIREKEEVIVRGRLTLAWMDAQGRERRVHFEDFGSDFFKAGVEAGNTYKSAATDCLKRCARQVGIALDLYERAERTEEKAAARARDAAARWESAALELAARLESGESPETVTAEYRRLQAELGPPPDRVREVLNRAYVRARGGRP